jgi:DNA-nicking Smr family endonuclease
VDKQSDLELWNYVKKSAKRIITHKNLTKKTKTDNLKKNVNIEKYTFTDIKIENNNLTDNKPINFTVNNKKSGLSKRSIRELRSGKFEIEKSLDLHGYRVIEAEKVFFNFLLRCLNLNIRNILIITGKGNDGNGKIKQSLPIWLNDPKVSKFVYVYSFASKKDGGEGAFYIRLRNTKIF